jgi:hypothetical protein
VKRLLQEGLGDLERAAKLGSEHAAEQVVVARRLVSQADSAPVMPAGFEDLPADVQDMLREAMMRTPPPPSRPSETRKRWTGRNTALCFAGTTALLAAVGMSLEADLMFAPFISIPLGVFVWLITLVMLGEWLLGRSPLGFLNFPLILFLWIPFAIGGWALIFKDRAWLTSPQDILGSEDVKFSVYLWIGFACAGVILLLTGLMSRTRSE